MSEYPQDPSISPEANRILTGELREAVGDEAVDAPANRPSATRQRHGGRSGLAVTFAANRLAASIGLLSTLVIAAVLLLTTRLWWLLALVVVVLLLAMIVVVFVTLQMTTETEHLSPTAAARLEAEGVADPDAAFSDLVEDVAPGEPGKARGHGRETPVDEQPARAASEQRSAVTPSHDRSKPVGPGDEDG
jgi:hypothetical protein